MGRHAGSWAKISLFYFVFYSILAGFCAGMMMIFFQTVSETRPSQTGMDSLIKGNPGMAFRPMPKVSSTLIKFNEGEEDTWRKYTDNIKILLHKYRQEQEDCADCYQDCNAGVDAESELPCKFDLDEFLGAECTDANNYGYDTAEPCVLMKLNKIFEWEPEAYDTNDTSSWSTEAQEDLLINYPEYTGDGVAVTCMGENFGDQDNLGEIKFFPASGFMGTFFPFTGQKGYQAPLVFMKMSAPTKGTLIQVYCKAWAKNIYHHKNDKAGSMRFEVLIN